MTGVKVVSMVFALIGAALGLTYTPTMTKKLAIGAILSGLIFGALGPEAVAYLAGKTLGIAPPLPVIVNNGLAVVFGIGGMFIVPGVVKLWSGFAENPWAWVDRLRGQGGKNEGGGQ
jgi:hypothetical protein